MPDMNYPEKPDNCERDWKADLELCDKATKGPWEVELTYHDKPGYEQYIKRAEIVFKDKAERTNHIIARMDWSCPKTANLDFIATAREALPYYITQWKTEYDRCNQFINDIANLRDENDAQQAEIVRLRELLVSIEKRCDSIDSDCQEGDKVRCHSEWIRCEVARVYPKYSRKEREAND